ncbi:MAG: hypothetical protein R3A52_14675 [Polyangiales bacterium]
MTKESLRVGVDENGLGPWLGPMLVTGVRAAVRGDVSDVTARAAALGVGDSKATGAHGAMRALESRVLAVLDGHLGLRPTSLDELAGMLSLRTEAELRALCPSGAAPEVCFGGSVALPAFGGSVSEGAAVAEALREAGLTLVEARFVTVCAGRLNHEAERGRGRFDLDLDAMVDLVAALRRGAPGELTAVCGKVGGRKSYVAAMDRLGALPVIVEEKPERSAYRVRGVGEVSFARDADAGDVTVGLASMIGKYLRELMVERQHRWYAARVAGLRPASGYHDPVTARYVAATKLVREREGVPDRCFER